MLERASPPQPVDRGPLFRSDLVAIHDNRCQRTDRGLSPPTTPLPFHEVCLPRRGVWIRHREGHALPVTPGTVHFFNRGEVHGVSHPRGCGDRNTGLLVDDATLRAMVDDLDPRALDERGAPFARTHAEADPTLLLLHALLLRHLAEPACAQGLLAEELALGIVQRALVGRTASSGTRGAAGRAGRETARRHQALVDAVREHLALHFRESLGLRDVAAAVGSSVHHLCRVYRARTGATIHGHLLGLRLHAALEPIAAGAPLADVAAATGFADRTHLSHGFRRAFGLTPSAFRRRASRALVQTLGSRARRSEHDSTRGAAG